MRSIVTYQRFLPKRSRPLREHLKPAVKLPHSILYCYHDRVVRSFAIGPAQGKGILDLIGKRHDLKIDISIDVLFVTSTTGHCHNANPPASFPSPGARRRLRVG